MDYWKIMLKRFGDIVRLILLEFAVNKLKRKI
jgi:hypothetical protein